MFNGLVSEDFLKKVDDGYGIDPEDPLSLEDNEIVIPEVDCSVSGLQAEALASINVLSKSDVMGVDIYLSLKHTIVNRKCIYIVIDYRQYCENIYEL